MDIRILKLCSSSQSYPLGRQEWLTPSGRRIMSGSSKDLIEPKYSITEERSYSFKVSYKLVINKVEHSDAGKREMNVSVRCFSTCPFLHSHVVKANSPLPC